MERTVSRRQALLPLVEWWGRSRGLLDSGSALIPVGQGKKALVFLVSGARGGQVVRLFSDPLRYLRYLRAGALMENHGVPVPYRMASGISPALWGEGVWAFSMEERLTLSDCADADLARGTGETLGRLHGLTRGRWGGLFLPSKGSYARLLVTEAVSRVEAWWGHFGLKSAPRLKEWFRGWEPYLSQLEAGGYQLVHRDIALANMGLRGHQVVLLDIVRAGYGFALEDVVAALDMLHRQPVGHPLRLEAAFWEGYTQHRVLSDHERGLLPFFQASFHAKRLKRAMKHIKRGEAFWWIRAAYHLWALSCLTDSAVEGSAAG